VGTAATAAALHSAWRGAAEALLKSEPQLGVVSVSLDPHAAQVHVVTSHAAAANAHAAAAGPHALPPASHAPHAASMQAAAALAPHLGRLGLRLHSQGSVAGARERLERQRSASASPLPRAGACASPGVMSHRAGSPSGPLQNSPVASSPPLAAAGGVKRAPVADVEQPLLAGYSIDAEAAGEGAGAAQRGGEEAAAAAAGDGVETLELGIGGMSCSTCARAIEGAMKQVGGVVFLSACWQTALH